MITGEFRLISCKRCQECPNIDIDVKTTDIRVGFDKVEKSYNITCKHAQVCRDFEMRYLGEGGENE